MKSVSTAVRSFLQKKRFNSAVILAAGKGTRFSETEAKQYAEIGGKPVLWYSALAFEKSDYIDEIIVVCPAQDVNRCRKMLSSNGIKKLTHVVPGGATRTESAKRGFEAVNPACEYVAIHDAARCLVTPKMIEETFSSAYVYGAAAAASRVTDTLKKTDSKDVVQSTVDRENMWGVQTPQIFSADRYRAALYYAEQDRVTATDDCALCERIGLRVKMVDVGRTNIKITYPDDIVIAEAILAKRKKEQNT